MIGLASFELNRIAYIQTLSDSPGALVTKPFILKCRKSVDCRKFGMRHFLLALRIEHSALVHLRPLPITAPQTCHHRGTVLDRLMLNLKLARDREGVPLEVRIMVNASTSGLESSTGSELIGRISGGFPATLSVSVKDLCSLAFRDG
jgi:hypothetical protein